MQSFTRPPPFPPTHKSQIPIGGGHMWHETNKKSRYGGDVWADALSWAGEWV